MCCLVQEAIQCGTLDDNILFDMSVDEMVKYTVETWVVSDIDVKKSKMSSGLHTTNVNKCCIKAHKWKVYRLFGKVIHTTKEVTEDVLFRTRLCGEADTKIILNAGDREVELLRLLAKVLTQGKITYRDYEILYYVDIESLKLIWYAVEMKTGRVVVTCEHVGDGISSKLSYIVLALCEQLSSVEYTVSDIESYYSAYTIHEK